MWCCGSRDMTRSGHSTNTRCVVSRCTLALGKANSSYMRYKKGEGSRVVLVCGSSGSQVAFWYESWRERIQDVRSTGVNPVGSGGCWCWNWHDGAGTIPRNLCRQRRSAAMEAVSCAQISRDLRTCAVEAHSYRLRVVNRETSKSRGRSMLALCR